MMELPGKESTEFGKGRRDTSGFSFLITAMGANVESDGSLAGEESNPAMNRFTGKPYDEDLQAYVFPFRNYSAKLARWTSADPAGFPDGPNRHFYATVPTSGLDPMGLEATLISTHDTPATRLNPEEWTYGAKERFYVEGDSPNWYFVQESGIKKFTHWEEGTVLNNPSGSVSVGLTGAEENPGSFNLGGGAGGISFQYKFKSGGVDSISGGGTYDQPFEPEEGYFRTATVLIAKGDIVKGKRWAWEGHGWDPLSPMVDWGSWNYSGVETNIRTGEIGVRWKYYEI